LVAWVDGWGKEGGSEVKVRIEVKIRVKEEKEKKKEKRRKKRAIYYHFLLPITRPTIEERVLLS